MVWKKVRKKALKKDVTKVAMKAEMIDSTKGPKRALKRALLI